MSRASWLRAGAVVVITASVTLGAACSDEDVVDTIPPPRPNRTTSLDGPQEVPRVTATELATDATSTTATTATTKARTRSATSRARSSESTPPAR